ncbi:hypothetical protein JG688_00011245, partial [Phytophthora aleatoria]
QLGDGGAGQFGDAGALLFSEVGDVQLRSNDDGLQAPLDLSLPSSTAPHWHLPGMAHYHASQGTDRHVDGQRSMQLMHPCEVDDRTVDAQSTMASCLDHGTPGEKINKKHTKYQRA